MLDYETGGKENAQNPSPKLVYGLAKPSKPCSHHRPAYHPLFVCHFYALITPSLIWDLAPY